MSLAAIQERMKAACADARRPFSSVELVAVSKTQPADRVQAVLDAGQRVFGENRVQEAQERWQPLREKFGDLRLHLIGHLQTNKAKDAVALFDVIETVDSEKLACALKNEMQKQNRRLPCFIQVNTGEEPQKGGVSPRDLEKLLRFCREEAALDISGLMCIPPADEIPDPHFALLHKLAAGFGLAGLSMGMSADFDRAIRYGATQIRVGSALFGIRENT
ncbi:MAG TPA: YggS family pyridoxal phosphate-dependent enzyme [Patescibacteria group bacterium]|nr:YggS family pyridoxal phosphate-dependent enzyme [Patescibacteria group bacterium]